MIKANHTKWARALYEAYIYRQMRKNFTGMFETNQLPDIPENQSLLVTPNHISWWDGFIIEKLLTKRVNKTIHLMMLEKELKKVNFFSKVGAFSIDQENSASTKETILYTREVLKNSLNYCVVYPQGEIEPFEKPKLTIKKGIQLFIKTTNTMILPVAFKIQHENKKFPSIYVRYGSILPAVDVLRDFALFEEEFIKTRDSLNNHIFDKKESGKNLL